MTAVPAQSPASDSAAFPGRRAELALAPILTLVLWVGCLLVGGLGFVLPYSRPQPPPPATTIQAELLKVDLSSDPPPAPAAALPTPPESAEPPPLFAPPALPQAPQLVAVALPSPAVAFAGAVASAVLAVAGIDGIDWPATLRTGGDSAAVVAAAGVATWIGCWVTPITRQYGAGAR